MGFRNGAYATIWEVKPISDVVTRARISISKKDKKTGQYYQDFGGFVSFVGSSAAKSSLSLKERDRIKIGETEVTTKYDKAKKISYTNFNIFSFEKIDGNSNAKNQTSNNVTESQTSPDDLEDNIGDDNSLPF